MRVVAIAFAGAIMLGCAHAEQPAWPPDTWWSKAAAGEASRSGEEYETAFLNGFIETERSLVLGSDVIVLGRVAALEYYQGSHDETRTRIVIDVEEMLRGESEDGQVRTSISGGRAPDGSFGITSGIDPPLVGRRYIFFVNYNPYEPGTLRGGSQGQRFPIGDDIVVGKGVPLADFLSILRRELGPRSAARLFHDCDVAVVGTIKESKYRYFPTASGGTCFTPNPLALNYAQVEVEDVVKGDVARGEVLRVELPARCNDHQDVLNCEPDSRILIFLRTSSDGRWYPVGGKDAAMLIASSGEVGGFSSLHTLLSHVRGGEH